jgi:hypothetical protein
MKRKDLRMLLLALVLLALPAAWFFWSSSGARQRRETTLAGVPQFPAPGQPPRRKHIPPRPAAPAPPPPPPAGAAQGDRMVSFVLAPAPSVGLVQVNALFNTPLFERFKECLPEDFRHLEEAGKEIGIDVTRDIDRVAMIPGGTAVSGFFEGKPIAEAMLARSPGALDRRGYRGQTILSVGGRCAVQMGNLVLLSPQDKCESLIDRAYSPAPAGAADEVYGDLFLRSGTAQLREANPAPELRQLFDALDRVTVRANVWDSVALTIEGDPQGRRDARELGQMARGAIGVVRSQLDDEDVEMQALADLAQVSTRGGKLEVNLALPAQDLFDRLHFPCAARDR